jgi:hyperosmotically inducible protein
MRTANLVKSLFPMVLLASMTIACSQADSIITARIKASMATDTKVNASHIEVATDKKVVTLTGNIDSQAEKDRALEIARATSGVVKVVDMIEVRTGAESGEAPHPDRTLGERIDDAAITIEVKTRLLEDPQVKGSQIDVDTREGVVFLTGSVRNQEENDRAVEVARTTQHVKDVKPNLVVTKG